MINYLDDKYINLISHHLLRFKKIAGGYNFRCCYCGDSKKSESKARAWLYANKKTKDTQFKCHNCGMALSFKGFLKDQNQVMYGEYLLESMSGNAPETQKLIPLKPKPKPASKPKLQKPSDIVSVHKLPIDHFARKYVDGRGIKGDIYFTEEFKAFTNKYVPDTFPDIKSDEPRLVIPFRDQKGVMFGFQGRSFKDFGVKYLTIMIDPDAPKVYNLDKSDLSKRCYVVEGPIDAMFLPNSLASAGGKLETNLPKIGLNKDKAVIIYDNEPRSPHTIHKMISAVDAGYSICVWPQGLKECDINDMVLSGLNPLEIIDDNTYTGLYALAKISEWRIV